MTSFNKAILAGNITRDIEVRYTQGGTAVASVGLAVNRTYFNKAKNERQEEVLFIDCTAWGRTAEVIGEYCGKGSKILVEGYLKLDEWNDKNSGEKRSKIGLVVDNFQFIGKRDGDGGGGRQSQGGDQQREYAGQQSAPGGFADDDVPF